MKRTLLFLLLVSFQVALAFQESVVTGKLLGFDGKPIAKAHAELIKAPTPKAIASIDVSPDGSFKLSTTETGLLFLQCAGVNHASSRSPLLLEKPATLNVEVHLRTYKYLDEIKEVKIIGDFNDFNFGTAKTMEKKPDGTFIAEFESKADKFKYQIWGVEATQRSVNGTQSESYEYDKGGDYQSVVTPKDGKVVIVFDPKKLVRSSAAQEFHVRNNERLERFASFFDEMTKRSEDFSAAAQSYQKSGKDMKEFQYDWSKDVSSVALQLNNEKDQTLRQFLMISYLRLGQFGAKTLDKNIAEQVLKELDLASPFLSLSPMVLRMATSLAGKEAQYDEYLQKLLDKNPDKNLKANILFNEAMMAKFRNDDEHLKKYYNILMNQYGDTPMAQMAKNRLSLDSKIAVGKPVPTFSVVSINDSKKTYSNESMKGKYYLIDFWAVWCGPCVAEMGNLHKAYERFKSKNFEILSLSFDPKPEDVKQFREQKWKMPWLHTFVEKGFESPLAKEFEVVGIPRPVLVDPAGKIIAMEIELRGPNLEKTLEKLLKEAN